MINNNDKDLISYSFTDNIDRLHRFRHKAMNTIYEIMILHEDKIYAEQAASAAFNEIDRLELELSRFIDNSDISRINAMKRLDTTIVGNDCYQCLLQCKALYQQTRGVFDISAGFMVDLWKKLPADQDKPDDHQIQSAKHYSGMPWLHLLNNFQVQLMSEKISLDLGGFGKGYAVQVAADLLQDWDVVDGVISAGMSTIMPFGENKWPVTIRHPEKTEEVLETVELQNKTISGSGVRKGQHIIDPRSGYPVNEMKASWVIADQPGQSDALSTAFMIMSLSEIEDFCDLYKTSALLVTAKNKVIKKGDF
jgi:FAD:protein FMN transferase